MKIKDKATNTGVERPKLPLGPLTGQTYAERVLPWVRAQGPDAQFPVLDSLSAGDIPAMKAWLAFYTALGLPFRAKSVRECLRRECGETRWGVPTRFPSELTGDLWDDLRPMVRWADVPAADDTRGSSIPPRVEPEGERV